MVEPLTPVFHVTEPTQPLAVKVALAPKQIVFVSTVTVGFGFTMILPSPVALQLLPLVQVAV